jgi:predicted transcriptional regulator
MAEPIRKESIAMASPRPSVKERMVEIIEAQPADSSFDEILRELAFARMIEQGLRDVDQGRTVSHDEVRREVESWGK